MRRALAAIAVAALLAACTARDQGPSTGTATDDYKTSPCACAEVPQRYKNQFVG